MDEKDIPEWAFTRCDYCKARTVWTKSDGDKALMVEVRQGADGNLRLTLHGKTLRASVVRESLAFGNTTLHKPHIANCPKAPARTEPRTTRRGNRRRA